MHEIPWLVVDAFRAWVACVSVDNRNCLFPWRLHDAKFWINWTWTRCTLWHIFQPVEINMTLFPWLILKRQFLNWVPISIWISTRFQALPNPYGQSIYSIVVLYETWYELAYRIMFPKGALILPRVSLMRNSKGHWIKGRPLFYKLFPHRCE